MELTLADKISLRTKQMVMKADNYVRETDSNGYSKAFQHGLILSATTTILAIAGVAAMVMTAGAATPVLASIASVASLPATTIGGVSFNVAGATLFGGPIVGAGLSAFSKIAATISKSIKKQDDSIMDSNGQYLDSNSIHGNFEYTTDKGVMYNVKRRDLLKSIADGSFSEKYPNFKDATGHQHVIKEGNSVALLEEFARLPYQKRSFDNNIIQPSLKSALSDADIIRREVFMNTTDINIANNLNPFKKMGAMREKFFNNSNNNLNTPKPN